MAISHAIEGTVILSGSEESRLCAGDCTAARRFFAAPQNDVPRDFAVLLHGRGERLPLVPRRGTLQISNLQISNSIVPMTVQPLSKTVPELMAPAGDWDCAARRSKTGLTRSTSAFRAVSTLGPRGQLWPGRIARIDDVPPHSRRQRLPDAQHARLRRRTRGGRAAARVAIAAGVDAVLVQDVGLLRLLGRLCPELPLHASTQMTLEQRRVHPRGRVAGRAKGRAAARAFHRPDRRHPPANGNRSWKRSSTAPFASAIPANASPVCRWAAAAPIAANAPSPAACRTR